MKKKTPVILQPWDKNTVYLFSVFSLVHVCIFFFPQNYGHIISPILFPVFIYHGYFLTNFLKYNLMLPIENVFQFTQIILVDTWFVPNFIIMKTNIFANISDYLLLLVPWNIFNEIKYVSILILLKH